MASTPPLRLPIVIEVDGAPLAERLDVIETHIGQLVDAVLQLTRAVLAQGVTLASVSTDTRSIMADLTPIAEEVAGISGEVASAVTLLDRLADMIEDTNGDPAEVAALAAQVRAQRQALGEAIAAVPAEPEPG